MYDYNKSSSRYRIAKIFRILFKKRSDLWLLDVYNKEKWLDWFHDIDINIIIWEDFNNLIYKIK